MQKPVPFEAEDSVDDPVQEVPVVGDRDHDAREMVQIVLQDLQRLDVKVIGGLVQDQHVGSLHQHAQQIQPPLLPAGQLGDGCVLLAPNEQESLAHG